MGFFDAISNIGNNIKRNVASTLGIDKLTDRIAETRKKLVHEIEVKILGYADINDDLLEEKNNGDENAVKENIKKLFKNVAVLDSGARGATTSFVQRGQGDVLIAWENEAILSQKDAPDDYEIVIPSISILAEPSVAIVDSVVDQKGTRKLAEAYINYLYSPEGQEIAAKNFYRPRDKAVAEKYKNQFPALKLVTVDEAFGGWAKAQKDHFTDGGTFDQIYAK